MTAHRTIFFLQWHGLYC